MRNANYHLTTGFVGTPYLCHVLSRFGYTNVAYELLNQETFPSWLYPVKKGATTIWERWDGIKPDGSFQDAGMNSFNHYAYGAIGEWLYRVVAGIDVDVNAPGYKHIFFQPQPGGGLTHARATLNSPYGRVASAWELTGEDFRLSITVPPNTHATVRLPATSLAQITESGRAIANAHVDGDSVVIEVGSGEYTFVTSALNHAKAIAGVRHVAGRLDRYCTLRELLANDTSKAVLATAFPADVLQRPMMAWRMDESLAQLSQSLPQIISPESVDAVELALGVHR